MADWKKEESGLESLSSYDPRRSLNTHYDRHLVAYIGDLWATTIFAVSDE